MSISSSIHNVKNIKKKLERLNVTINDLSTTVGLTFLKHIQVGLEREGLRINENGTLNQLPHPIILGSAMTHPSITTDFAENLLEFVTKPHSNVVDALTELDEITHFTLHSIKGQNIWPGSMPPKINNEDDIPVGQYGHSNQGKMKHLYRKGLSLRYGKMMQAIAGIHYNFSLTPSSMETYFKSSHPDNLIDPNLLQNFQSERYLNLARNANRFGFIIPYLFGVSPAVSSCFFGDKAHSFEKINDEDLGLPFATSLRLSDIGYSNKKCHFFVSTDSLNEYITDLNRAVITPCPDFTALGVIENNVHLQLNDHILQIENEYYTSIRPKQVLQAEERPLCALKKRGIQYVELRSLDVNPLIGIGVDLDTMRFIQVFLTMCLLVDADPLGYEESAICAQNLKNVAQSGRDLMTEIVLLGETMPLKDSLIDVLSLMRPIANILGEDFVSSLDNALMKINDVNLTPSAKMVAMMKQNNKTHHETMLELASSHTTIYSKISPSTELLEKFNQLTNISINQQKAIEATDTIDFDEYLKQYLNKAC